MKKIKIISGNLNNSFATIPATTIGKSGKISSLKKDGTLIEGREPWKEEESMLWHFQLTTKERVDKHNTRLYSVLYIPEEGIDLIDDNAKRMIALYKHLSNHQLCAMFKVVDGNRSQVNANFRRNHMLYFEIIDESAIEDEIFKNSRMEAKYRVIIDELFDQYNNDGEFLEVCYGVGIGRPEKNSSTTNYNLLVNKLQLNPHAFKHYWEDEDRSMVNVIQKGMKKDNPETDLPYITQNETGLYFFNGNAIGKTMEEVKIHFKQHDKEFGWLQTVVATKKQVIAVAEKPEYTSNATVESVVTPTPRKPSGFENNDGADARTRSDLSNIKRQIGLIISIVKKGKKPEAQNRLQSTIDKNPKHKDYITRELDKKLLEQGLSIT